MIVKAFDKEIIDQVLSGLWQRGKDEAELFGLSVEDLKAGFVRKIGQPWALSFHVTHSAPAAAICYMDFIGIYKWRTYFAATEEGFNGAWLPISVFMKRISDYLVKEGNETGYIESLSDGRNKKAEEWFNSMGFILLSSMGNINKYVKFGKMYAAVGHGATMRG